MLNTKVSHFDKRVITDNSKYVYFLFLCVFPGFILFRLTFLWGMAALVVSLVLFLFDPSLKKFKEIKKVNYLYYFVSFTGLILSIICVLFTLKTELIDKIFYIWAFSFFILNLYVGRVFNKVRYSRWYI